MEDTEDQVQDETVETTEASEEETKSDEGQSETTSEEDVETSKRFKTPDGRELTADEINEEYTKLLSDYTKKSQKLSEYEKQVAEREARATEEAEQSMADNELLKDVDPNVKEAIIQIVKPELTRALEEREARAEREANDKAFQERLSSLEEKYSGKDGLPKFDRAEILQALQEPGNEVFDPEIKFMIMNKEKFDDHLIKQAIKNKKGGPATESTGSSTPRRPQSKTPTSWEEAAKSAISRLT